jgi:hypothetical protein
MTTDLASSAHFQPAALVFTGGAQPNAPRRALSGVPGFSIPPLSVDRRAAQTNAEMVALSQAEPWTYLYLGSSGPYMPAKLDAAITAVRVDPPPPASSRPIHLALAQINQADPWAYLFLGHQQPYTSAKIAGSNFPAGPTPLDRRVFQTNSELAALAQPDPWTFAFFGGGQPYAPLRQSPGIPGLDRDPPPLDRRTLQNLYAQPSYQSDPWSAMFGGGLAPYQPKILNAQSVFVEVDNPPFEQSGPVAEIALVTSLAQPDPWSYALVGGAQPYTPRTLPPSITAVEVDAPPNALAGGPYALTVESIALSQPDVWAYAFDGNAQPYGYGLLDPTLSAVRVDNPPGMQTPQWPTIVAAWMVQDFPVQPNYKLKITVRIGRSRAVVIA